MQTGWDTTFCDCKSVSPGIVSVCYICETLSHSQTSTDVTKQTNKQTSLFNSLEQQSRLWEFFTRVTREHFLIEWRKDTRQQKMKKMSGNRDNPEADRIQTPCWDSGAPWNPNASDGNRTVLSAALCRAAQNMLSEYISNRLNLSSATQICHATMATTDETRNKCCCFSGASTFFWCSLIDNINRKQKRVFKPLQHQQETKTSL